MPNSTPTARTTKHNPTTPDRTACRFRVADLVAITTAVETGVTAGLDELELIRVGARSVGCTPYDLRDTELSWIRGIVELATRHHNHHAIHHLPHNHHQTALKEPQL